MVPLVLVKNPIKITMKNGTFRRLPDPFGIRPPGVQLPHGNRSPGDLRQRPGKIWGVFLGVS